MELHTYLSMVTQFGKLTDLPTFKDKIRQQPENVNYGLVGYPVLMTADIVLYKTDIVPVGIDQAPHLEFAREIVRSFNYRYQHKGVDRAAGQAYRDQEGAWHRWQGKDEQEPEQSHRACRHARRDDCARPGNGH